MLADYLRLALLHLVLHHIVLDGECAHLIREGPNLIEDWLNRKSRSIYLRGPHLDFSFILQLVHLVLQILQLCAELGVGALKRAMSGEKTDNLI